MGKTSKLATLARVLPTFRGEQAVHSLNVQAGLAQRGRPQTQFELLSRHLFGRLLANENFGEDAPARVAQLSYAIVLPGILVAMFLFPAYHGVPPHPLERPFWSQAADHLFYVTYAFVILGTATVFQWDLLFPDLLDLFVLSTLPIARVRLLLARVVALGGFLALVLLGTTGLSDLFFPAVADLKTGFWRHLFVHTLAVSLAGVFAALLLITLQSALLCLAGRRLVNALIPTVKSVAVVAFLTILFLFPLTAHYLAELVGLPAARLFPPFWFLGLYHVLLYGSAAQPVFRQLAGLALESTGTLAVLAVLSYPFAYRRRVRQLVEGTPLEQRASSLGGTLRRLLHRALVRTPQARATFHLAAQTLARLPRLHLYLAMYAGLGIAVVLSGLLVLEVHGGSTRAVLSIDGVRSMVPVLAFWTVAGLRTALLAPLGRGASWIFPIALGAPTRETYRGPEMLVSATGSALALAALGVLHVAVAALHLELPPEARGSGFLWTQVLLALALPVLLTDVFFLPVRSLPFTVRPLNPTRELPLTLVRYLVIFPAFVLYVTAHESWIETSWAHLLAATVAAVVAHAALQQARMLVLTHTRAPTGQLFTTLRLRED